MLTALIIAALFGLAVLAGWAVVKIAAHYENDGFEGESDMKKLIQNFHKSPVSTLCGIIVAALLAVSHQPDLKHLGIAFGIAIWGIVTKEN